MSFDEIKRHSKAIEKIAAKYGIKKVSVFGSVARGDNSSTSDIDFLVELLPGASALGIGGFQHETQQLLGIHVDVVPTFALSEVQDKEFVKTIQHEAVSL